MLTWSGPRCRHWNGGNPDPTGRRCRVPVSPSTRPTAERELSLVRLNQGDESLKALTPHVCALLA